MSRTERKVNDLIDEDPSMEDAIAVVKKRTEENGGVEWADVSDDITDGQWGRMIQEGVVVDNGDGGFVLSDPDAVDDVISEDTKIAAETTVEDDDDVDYEGWSTYDKLAGVGVLAVMAGYYYPPIKNLVGGTLDLFLGPLDAALPFYVVILVLAMFTGVYSTLLQSKLMNTELIQKQQEKMKALRERKKAAKERDDEEALDRIKDEEMEMMGDQMAMFKEQFRPMVWVTLITIPMFLWLYYMVEPGTGATKIVGHEPTTLVMPMVGETTWSGGAVGPIQTWIVWYFLCSMGFTQLIRKAVNLETMAAS